MVKIQVGLKSCSFHRRIQWRNSFCPTRLLLPRRDKNVPKIVPRTWSPRGKLELSSPRGRTSSPRGRTLSPRDIRKTSVLVTVRNEKKTFLPARGDQSRSFSVHLFSRHFWLSWPGGAELGKMSFTIEFVYENYNF